MGAVPVRIGVLGCADTAWRRTLPAITDSAHADVVAVASRDGAKAARFAERFDCDAVADYDALLDRADVDAVYVPLPTGLHARWCAAALRAGKHVLVEKPVAGTHGEAVELAALARELGLCLMENRTFPFHSQHDAVRKLVADGAIGELRVLSATMAIPAVPPTDIRWRADLGGGALLDVGYYPLHAALHVLPEPIEVVGASLRRDQEHGVDVAGSVLLRAGDGATAHVTFGFEHAYRSSYELWGGAGRLLVDRAFTPAATWQPVLRLEQQDRVEEITLPASDQRRDTIDAFAAAVRGDAAAAALLDRHLETTVRGAALIDAVRAMNGPWESP